MILSFFGEIRVIRLADNIRNQTQLFQKFLKTARKEFGVKLITRLPQFKDYLQIQFMKILIKNL